MAEGTISDKAAARACKKSVIAADPRGAFRSFDRAEFRRRRARSWRSGAASSRPSTRPWSPPTTLARRHRRTMPICTECERTHASRDERSSPPQPQGRTNRTFVQRATRTTRGTRKLSQYPSSLRRRGSRCGAVRNHIEHRLRAPRSPKFGRFAGPKRQEPPETPRASSGGSAQRCSGRRPSKKKQKEIDTGIRTQNLVIRSHAPYPLGHTDSRRLQPATPMGRGEQRGAQLLQLCSPLRLGRVRRGARLGDARAPGAQARL